MSNITTQAQTALTEEEQSIQSLIQQEIQNIMETHAIDFRPAKIGIVHRDKKFKTVDDRLSNTISGVILVAQKTRGYWENEGDKSPRCSSINGLQGKYKSGDLQSPEMSDRVCANCPLNCFGSAEKGQGKACKEMRRLFIVEDGDNLPSILNIPPTSIKAFDTYVSGLLTKGKAPLVVETTFRLEGAQGVGFDYSKVTFERTRDLGFEEIKNLLQMRSQVETSAAKMEVDLDDYMNEAAAGSADTEDMPY
jgi:hypothetical protein